VRQKAATKALQLIVVPLRSIEKWPVTQLCVNPFSDLERAVNRRDIDIRSATAYAVRRFG